MGRPTKRNQKLIDKLLLGLEAGRYENELCAELDVHPTNVRIWKRQDPELRAMVNEARRDGILARLETDKLALEAAIGAGNLIRAVPIDPFNVSFALAIRAGHCCQPVCCSAPNSTSLFLTQAGQMSQAPSMTVERTSFCSTP